jgi:hypothetical protein
MCIHLLNPPEPSCQPDDSGRIAFPRTGLCGTCHCIPRYWRLQVSIPLTGNPAVDVFFQEFAGEFLLERRIPIPDEIQARCAFVSPPHPLDFLGFQQTPVPAGLWR